MQQTRGCSVKSVDYMAPISQQAVTVCLKITAVYNEGSSVYKQAQEVTVLTTAQARIA